MPAVAIVDACVFFLKGICDFPGKKYKVSQAKFKDLIEPGTTLSIKAKKVSETEWNFRWDHTDGQNLAEIILVI